MIYLDHAAGTPPLPELVQEHARHLLAHYANPHAGHAAAREEELAVRRAQSRVLRALGLAENLYDVIWTSGGTEANNLALRGLELRPQARLLMSAAQHPSVQEPLRARALAQGLPLRELPLDKSTAALDLALFAAALAEGADLVALTAVHGESAAVTDLVQVRALLQKQSSRALLHVDAVQAPGKAVVDYAAAAPDTLSLAGHKMHGLPSTGALIKKRNLRLQAQLLGGGQQSGWRSGTVDAAACLGFAQALELAVARTAAEERRLRPLRERLVAGLQGLRDRHGRAPELRVCEPAQGVPQILFFSLTDYQGAVLMRSLSAAGVVVGTGSACSAQSGKANELLEHLGWSRRQAFGALRVSLGVTSTMADVEAFLSALQQSLRTY